MMRQHLPSGPKASLALVALFATLGLLAGCTVAQGGSGSFQAKQLAPDAPDAHLSVHFTDNSAADHVAVNAITDIQQYWTQEMPAVFNKAYRPVKGGFYSADPASGQSVPCAGSASAVKNNAFYCASADVVVWDRTNLFPVLEKDFGKYSIAMVLAHEWGHAIQARTKDPGRRTIVIENQADCYSGAFTAWAYAGNAPHFHISIDDLDKAFAGYLSFADNPGDDPNGSQAHGSGFDRVSSFQQGFDSGPTFCADPKIYNDHKVFTETRFQPNDQGQGNLPLSTLLKQAPPDMGSYWKAALPKLFNVSGAKDLGDVQGYDPASEKVTCGGTKITPVIMYCKADDKVYLQTPFAQAVYSKTGDNGVATMIGIGYGYAIRDRLGKSTNDQNALLGAICYTGLYDADAFNASVGAKTTLPKHALTLSPGDLDEAIEALLIGVSDTAFTGTEGTTGFLRVNVFQNAVKTGAGACTQY
ncbi:MAG: neutral zinc metallopeptidase [Mycobacteriales bacterium]